MTFESDLLASGPAPAFASELALFGRFVGRWRVRNALFSEPAEEWARSDPEWVIAGRGIQDVLVDDSGSALGTTVRTWDKIRGWRVVWFCPRAAEHVVLSAAPDGDDIRLEEIQADRRRGALGVQRHQGGLVHVGRMVLERRRQQVVA